MISKVQMGSNYIKNSSLARKRGFSGTRQFDDIKAMFPDLQVLKLKGNSFEVIIKLQPTIISKIYEVKLTYDKYKGVDVFVVKEKLEVAKNRDKLPHVWSHSEQKLCLYSWKKRQWTKEKLISTSIIPWASEWLEFYEIWLISGLWLGGGHDEYSKPGKKNPENV